MKTHKAKEGFILTQYKDNDPIETYVGSEIVYLPDKVSTQKLYLEIAMEEHEKYLYEKIKKLNEQ